MRTLFRDEPRWAVLLLTPVLLAAGALPSPDAPAPRAGAELQPAADAVVLDAPVLPRQAALVRAEPAVVHAVRHAARTAVDRAERAAAPSPEQRGRAALRALAYDPATLGYEVRFRPYRGGVLGSTNRRTRLITVHVSPGQSELVLRATLAHEIGHALDFTHGTPARRDAYRKVRRLPAGPWFPCDRCNDLDSPAGDFAEVFAVWLAGPGDFRGRLQGPPSPAQLRELAPLLRPPPPEAGPSAAPSPQPSRTREPDRGLPVLLDPPPTPGPG